EDILNAGAEGRERLDKRLRERIQEAHELLALRLPIYLVFTKCDLLPGFTHFLRQLDPAARDEVMGKTFAHEGFAQADWGSRFASALDALVEHWQALADQQVLEQDIQLPRQDPAAYRL
ncbi:type VI secretion system protein, partial [Acinetobacter baumannii]|uniref:type VI secretion system protein n=1 Tax=Acinetobacter baumannii TaxID=470 RepID=UPI0033315221